MTYAQDPPLAFPSAEGFGKFSSGGRGGRVIEVTTLNCSGPGSFVDALQASGPRTIVFRVGGVIDCSNHQDLNVTNPYLTIAGQTAPGDGILVKGLSLGVSAHDTIIRYMQFRLGEQLAPGVDAATANALMIMYTHDVIVDHVSASWAPDDTTGAYEADNTTWQRSIISEGLHCAVPANSYCHGEGLGVGYNSPVKVSIHHNLLANTPSRNPIVGTGLVDLINNVMHNVGDAPHMQPFYAPVKLNFVGNYYSVGPDSNTGRSPIWFQGEKVAKFAPQSLAFVNGNIHPQYRPNNSRPELDIVYFSDGPSNIPTTTTRIPTMSYPSETDAFNAYNNVLADVGNNRRLNGDGTFSPRLGPVDTRIINEVKTGRGQIVFNSVNEVGGFPVLQNGTPYPDADHDGMSDVWEDKYGFNKGNST
ncbi:MAG: hypothetical protein ABI618_15510, partial [Nitrospirota bacterium]